MSIDLKIKKQLDHRLAAALGHLKKVRAMVSDDKYCIDILQQSLAVQNALKRIDEVLLKKHLKTCVSNAMNKGNKDRVVNEVIEIFKKGRR